MKITVTKNEISNLRNVVSMYTIDQDKIDEIMNLETVNAPGWRSSVDRDGNYQIEIKEDLVIGVVGAVHRTIFPHIGDIKAAVRLLTAAFDMIERIWKLELKKLSERFGIKYRYTLYAIDDPEYASERILFGIATPKNATGRKPCEIYHCHCGEKGRWNESKSLAAMGAATIVGEFDSSKELVEFADRLYKH